MRFFTIAWWSGELSDAEVAAVVAAERAHFESIRERLPPQFRAVRDGIPPLHDARLLDMRVDTRAQTARLELMDYEMKLSFALIYRGPLDVRASGHPKRGHRGPHGFGDLGYDELDIEPDGRFVHRLLFSSGLELELVFTEFDFEAPHAP